MTTTEPKLSIETPVVPTYPLVGSRAALRLAFGLTFLWAFFNKLLAGDTWGLGLAWARSRLVHRYPALR